MGVEECLLSRALSLHYLITLEHFKVNKLYKILFEGLLNDRYPFISPPIFPCGFYNAIYFSWESFLTAVFVISGEDL